MPSYRVGRIRQQKLFKTSQPNWQKDPVRSCWLGWHIMLIQGCNPLTVQCGGFELLSFDPGPVHLSLEPTWSPTPPRKQPYWHRTSSGHPIDMRHDMSGLPTSYHPQIPVSKVAGLQRHATTSDWEKRWQNGRLIQQLFFSLKRAAPTILVLKILFKTK